MRTSNYKVSILSIGTELTSGEVINSNAAWISDQLSNLGFQIGVHITIPDDRNAIQNALAQCTNGYSHLFVTGGLGPTTDDFTREEIAKFCNLSLEWDEQSWTRVVDRLKSVGAPIVENNRQQCFFPEDSIIFENNFGTANGFLVEFSGTRIYVLPGPPSEIKGIWHQHLISRLEAIVPEDCKMKLFRFICLGVSESKIGEIVEATLAESGVLTGYRARPPFIDVKLWVKPAQLHSYLNLWSLKVREALTECLVGESDFESAEDFLSSLPSEEEIEIVDAGTSGRIANKILVHLTTNLKIRISSLPTKLIDSAKFLKATIYQRQVFIGAQIETGQWSLELYRSGALKYKFTEKSRYSGRQNQARFESYLTEKSLILLSTWLTEFK